MYQWKTTSVIHAASALPGTSLSISQLIQVERHRGCTHSVHYAPRHGQPPPTPASDLIDSPPWSFLQNDQDFLAANVKPQANLTTLEIPDRGALRGLLYTACNPRVAQFRHSRVEANPLTAKIHRRHATRSASQHPPTVKDTSTKSLSTQTGSSRLGLPQLVPNKLPIGLKAPLKSVKQMDDAFRVMDHGETARTWPKSSEERKAEVKRKEEARLLKEAKKREVKEAQEEADRKHRQEQQQREAEARERAEAHAREQRIKRLKERRIARSLSIAPGLERVNVQLDDIRSQLEALLGRRGAARRKLWEEKAKTVEMTFDKILEKKERNSQLIANYSQSSTLLCDAIEDFCIAVGKDVQGDRYATLVNDRSPFLPRYMSAEGDSPHRIAHLCAIFWMYPHLTNLRNDTQLEAHLWRHLHSARKAHELHPDAFAYRPRLADWYCRLQRFVNNAHAFLEDHRFWEDHTEFVKPQMPSNRQRGKSPPDVQARSRRRDDLALFLRDMAVETKLDLSRMLDQGNFGFGRSDTDFKRQQQIAFRKPLTLVLEHVRETEQLVGSFGRLLNEVHHREQKIREFKNRMEEELRLFRVTITRPYMRELDILTYWNWLAIERRIPQKRLNYRRISRPTAAVANLGKADCKPAFEQIDCPDRTWRYTNFRGPHGQQVAVDYCTTHEFAERTADLFTSSRVIGIDLWGGRRFANVEDAVRDGNSPKRCIPMIAIANEERIALFHIASMRFDRYASRLPTLVRILEDPAIGKVGENIQAFRQRLLVYMGINMQGAVDLGSMCAWPSRSFQNGSIADSDPALERRSLSYAVYPPEPPTTMTLSDHLKIHFGQSLRDDMIRCDDLQIEGIRSPKLMQLSASRPYAALQLYRTLEHRSQTGGQQPSTLFERSIRNKTAELGLLTKPADEHVRAPLDKIKEAAQASSNGQNQRFQDEESTIAENDLGPTTIDPWSPEIIRDSQLEQLATALAKVIKGQTVGIIKDGPLVAYVLFTRFRQSCEDIYRILRIQEPADAILELIEATDLPINEAMLTVLKFEKDTMEGSNPEMRATKWIKKMIAGAPVLLRMHRRSSQVRLEFNVYAMWHRLEMSVEEIAEEVRKPKKEIFGLIRKTLKLGNPPFFPSQRARYLSLLGEYAPTEYAKELERTTTEASPPSAPWGAIVDIPTMSGLDSLDDGDFVRYIAGTKDFSSPDVFGGVKRLKLAEKAKVPKAFKAVKTVKASKTLDIRKTVSATKVAKPSKKLKVTKTVIVALKTKASPTIRSKVLSPNEKSRSKKNKEQASSSENSSTPQHVSVKTSNAPARGLKERPPRLAVPEKEISLKKGVTSEKNIGLNKENIDSGDSGWLQAVNVWTQTENSTVDQEPTRRGYTAKQPKASEKNRPRRMRRRAPNASGQPRKVPSLRLRLLHSESKSPIEKAY